MFHSLTKDEVAALLILLEAFHRALEVCPKRSMLRFTLQRGRQMVEDAVIRSGAAKRACRQSVAA